MEAASVLLEPYPAEMADSQAGELAPVIPLIPSPDKRGFLYQDLLSPDPRRIIRGIGRTASLIKHNVIGNHESLDRHPEEVILSDKGHDHLFLVTEPAADTGVDHNEALNTVFLPGLTEMGDMGSALRLHNAYAQHHPDRRVITKPTEGISHSGRLRRASKDDSRRQADVAADNLILLPRITEDGPIELSGTSLGTYLAMVMAEQDLAANPSDQLNITRLKLVASAVVARNVPENERFRDADIDEDVMRRELTKSFFQHLTPDLLRMAISNPADILGCAPIIGAYALYPFKAPSRAKAILADFSDVQQGVEWETVKQVALKHEVWVLGGEHDPLVQFQIPQWKAAGKLYPDHVRHQIVPGKGHLMTADARGTVKELAKMEAA